MIELLNRLFESREVSHAYHLQTQSFAEHKALEGYYESIVGLIDELVEVYQGQFGIIDGYQMMVRDVDMNDMLRYFEDLATYCQDKRKSVITPETEHLISILDDIQILIYKTLYKLKNLK
jgi:hypothetical protein